ncbi:hypothetical protein [Streptomyces sp. NRRL S-646]|uniref:hypothetical protein n=1 Tax=Streptomyces sp. NRRL S-646 TaxID=1463917 RepID=UPI0004CC82CA|nr:hypothetical protein [Streptomyces sp. NRRL S-646]
MNANYPLVEQREYGRPEKRGGLMKKRVMRDEGELPRLAPHHVRVFRVGAEYVEDHGQLHAEDPVVIGASSVTVVDRRIEVPVVVETRIPSAEAGDFTVRATFYCTVTDAKAVVRDGITDVEALLLSHLREVPGLTEDGSDQPIMNSAAVRERIDARLTAYHEMRPTVLSGLRARHGLVEVLTPAELAQHIAQLEKERWEQQQQQRREEREQQLALDRAEREAELELKREQIRFVREQRRERNRQQEAVDKELGRQDYETLRGGFDREAGAEQQKHDLTQRAEFNRFVRDQVQEDMKLLGANPLAADLSARHHGDITSDEYSKRVRGYDELQAERARLEREFQEKRAELDRQEERWKVEQKNQLESSTRAETLQRETAKAEEAARRWDVEHAEEVRQRDEDRQDKKQLLQDQHTWARQQLGAWTELTKQAFDRGLFDGQLSDPGAQINRVGDFSFERGPAQDGTAPSAVTNTPRVSIVQKSQDGGDAQLGDAEPDLGGTDSEGSLGH